MGCLTGEQLAALALGLNESERVAAHAEQCAACRAKLAELNRLTERLAAAYGGLEHAHAATRTRVLASLPSVEVAARPASIWNRLRHGLTGLSPGQRLAAGGLGLSTAVGLLLLILIVANSATSLSAMERMAKQLREVKSYSYKLFTRDTFVKEGETQPTTVIHTGITYWLEPGSLFYEEKLVRTSGPAFPDEPKGGLLSHFTGIHFYEKPGIFIYHAGRTASMARTYTRVPEMQPHEISAGPIGRLHMVREGAGRVLRELGTKAIEGREARGYVMALENAAPDSGFAALEVWVDPETDLPLEFGYEVKTDDRTSVFRITDCRWNIEIDPKLFDTTPPEGYEDITPPRDENTIAEMIAALKLYAQLSGGHYPRDSTFDATAVRDEMLRLARFTGSPQNEWNDDPQFRAIENAKSGLAWVERVLRNKYHAGYYGSGVGPQNEDKVLLWWTVDADDRYRVFYGDLRTEILPLATWARLVPEKDAAPHLPEDDEQSKE